MMTSPSKDRPFSVSAAQNFQRCPKSWEFKYVRGEDTQVPAENRDIGSAVHEALAIGFTEDLAAATATLGTEWSLRKIQSPKATYLRMVEGILSNPPFNPDSLLHVEVELREEVNGQPFIGYVDIAHRVDDETVKILDWKVTDNERLPEELLWDYQLNLYAWMSRSLYPWAKRFMVGHYYPKLRRGVEVEINPTIRDFVVSQLALLSESAGLLARGEARFPATPGNHCSWCDHLAKCPEGKSFT